MTNYIAVAGNIGSGKTTLTRLLAEEFDWEPEYESTDDNPYLADFYEDMARWSFPLQIYFLNSRFRQLDNVIQKKKRIVIQDRSIEEDCHIFAQNLRHSGWMSERDYQNYRMLFDSMMRFVPSPDLLIYLQADVSHLLRNIEKRGRAYERDIPEKYLTDLNKLYEKWIEQMPSIQNILIIKVEKIDFVQNSEHFSDITHQIRQKLNQIAHNKI